MKSAGGFTQVKIFRILLLDLSNGISPIALVIIIVFSVRASIRTCDTGYRTTQPSKTVYWIFGLNFVPQTNPLSD